MNITTQRKIAKSLLEKLKALDAGAILAGGAPRDWYFKRPANDLDFYFMLPDPRSWGDAEFVSLIHWLHNHDFKVSEKPFPKGVRYHENPNIAWVFEGSQDGLGYHLMALKSTKTNVITTTTDILSSFAFGLSQAWWTGIGDIKTSPDFKLSIKHKLLLQTGELYANQDSYLKKMTERFPDYLHVCRSNDDWAIK